MNTGRLDDIVIGLERLQQEAGGILDAHVDCLMRGKPHGTSWGHTRYEAFKPAGSIINYVKALQIVKDSVA